MRLCGRQMQNDQSEVWRTCGRGEWVLTDSKEIGVNMDYCNS